MHCIGIYYVGSFGLASSGIYVCIGFVFRHNTNLAIFVRVVAFIVVLSFRSIKRRCCKFDVNKKSTGPLHRQDDLAFTALIV